MFNEKNDLVERRDLNEMTVVCESEGFSIT